MIPSLSFCGRSTSHSVALDVKYYEDMVEMLDSPIEYREPDKSHETLSFNHDIPTESCTPTTDCSSECSSHNGCSYYSRENRSKSSIPGRFANYFAIGVNSHDRNAFRHYLLNICSPNVQISFNVYGMQSYLQGKSSIPTNLFGTFTHGDLSLEGMLNYYHSLFSIVPDGSMEIISSRTCYQRECHVYISYFKYTGTVISRDSIIGLGDYNGNLQEIRFIPEASLNHSAMSSFAQSFCMEGSLIMYRNRQGRVEKIELYYEFTE